LFSSAATAFSVPPLVCACDHAALPSNSKAAKHNTHTLFIGFSLRCFDLKERLLRRHCRRQCEEHIHRSSVVQTPNQNYKQRCHNSDWPWVTTPMPDQSANPTSGIRGKKRTCCNPIYRDLASGEVSLAYFRFANTAFTFALSR